MSLWQKHAIFEKNSIVLVIGVLIVIAIGGLVEIAPLFYLKNTIETVEGMRPYTPLELAGRNIYVREGCYNCHSQMIRPLRDRSVPDLISRASAANIPTTGTAITSVAQRPSSRVRSCRPIRGWFGQSLTSRISRMTSRCRRAWACRIRPR